MTYASNSLAHDPAPRPQIIIINIFFSFLNPIILTFFSLKAEFFQVFKSNSIPEPNSVQDRVSPKVKTTPNEILQNDNVDVCNGTEENAIKSMLKYFKNGHSSKQLIFF